MADAKILHFHVNSCSYKVGVFTASQNICLTASSAQSTKISVMDAMIEGFIPQPIIFVFNER